MNALLALTSSAFSSFVTKWPSTWMLQDAHRNMACPDGDMTVAERLYLMSFEDGVFGTKGLTPRQ
eukprot:3283817-Pleurochrysis_carterae.AAC.1